MSSLRYISQTRLFELRYSETRTFILRAGDCIISCFALCIFYWYGTYFTSNPVASVDLPGHIAITERLVDQLLSFRVRFYDPSWFSGWPAFQFYAFFAHLLTAILAFPLALCSAEPVRLASHLVLLSCCAFLPFSMRYLARALAVELFEEKKDLIECYDWLLAVLVCALGFWFLNHDRQWFGIGGAALFNVGLFSQGLGWHFLLVHVGALLRLARYGARYKRTTSLAYFFLFITHSLTAACSLFIALVVYCRYPERRALILKSHFLAIGLAGFWIVPFFWFSPQYLGQDIYRPAGDFLEIFFRYPLYGLLRTARAWLGGRFEGIEITNLLVLILIATAICSSVLQKCRLFSTLGLSLLLGLLIFSSGFVATSLPIGFHYYRFYGYLFLLGTVICAVVPLVWFANRQRSEIRESIIVLVCLLSIASNVLFPHYERPLILEHKDRKHLEDARTVLAYLRKQENVDRVLFGYFSDYKEFPFLSAHYMESRLQKELGKETLNGLFIQSSLAYRMPVASARLLGVSGYHIPLLFVDGAELSDRYKAQQLREFGVSHLVIGKKEVTQKIKDLALEPITEIGPYAIVRIAESASPRIEAVQKRVILYLDLKGNVPFHFFEFFLYARESLGARFELLEVKPGMNLPKAAVGIVVNGAITERRLRTLFPSLATNGRLALIPINYENPYLIDHYSVWYQHNIELDEYNSLEKYLAHEVRIASKLFPLVGPEPGVAAKTPLFSWRARNQEIDLKHLTPGQLYRINYSYFPYWTAEKGRVYRGSGERIFYAPTTTEATLHYSLFSHVSTWLGYAVTLISVILLVRAKRGK